MPDSKIIMKLEISMLPSRLCGKSLYHTDMSAWRKLRTACYERAGYRCEICEAQCVPGTKGAYAAHEVHKPDGTLERLQFVCIKCHGVIHFGRSTNFGYYEDALQHLMKVNRMSRAAAEKYAAEKSREWQQNESDERAPR